MGERRQKACVHGRRARRVRVRKKEGEKDKAAGTAAERRRAYAYDEGLRPHSNGDSYLIIPAGVASSSSTPNSRGSRPAPSSRR